RPGQLTTSTQRPREKRASTEEQHLRPSAGRFAEETYYADGKAGARKPPDFPKLHREPAREALRFEQPVAPTRQGRRLPPRRYESEVRPPGPARDQAEQR